MGTLWITYIATINVHDGKDLPHPGVGNVLPQSPSFSAEKNSDLAGLDEAAGTALESWDQPSTCFFLLSAAVRLLFLAFHTVTPSSGVNYHH